MKSLEEAIVLGPDPISNIIHSKDTKAVYTTADISRLTIVNTAKQYWSEHKYEVPTIPTVIAWLRKGEDDRLLFGQEMDQLSEFNMQCYITFHDYEGQNGLVKVVLTDSLSDYDSVGVLWY